MPTPSIGVTGRAGGQIPNTNRNSKGVKMAKAEIIDSHSLECLKSNLHSEIEEADSQIIVYEDELKCEDRHRQNEQNINRISGSIRDWLLRRDILHHCLCKIQNHIKEIEI